MNGYMCVCVYDIVSVLVFCLHGAVCASALRWGCADVPLLQGSEDACFFVREFYRSWVNWLECGCVRLDVRVYVLPVCAYGFSISGCWWECVRVRYGRSLCLFVSVGVGVFVCSVVPEGLCV